ncbi:hypothetical protein AB1Y20_016159 [Prymnesium parvum]|uniref:U-box domain-containing protein n=1 Tax=Prymnesium parvum TaxID=97485 RepID=A0AB34K0I7_PRYPA
MADRFVVDVVLPASVKSGDTVTFDVAGASFVLTLSTLNVPAFSSPREAIGGSMPTLKVSVPISSPPKNLAVYNLAINGVPAKDIVRADKAALALLGEEEQKISRQQRKESERAQRVAVALAAPAATSESSEASDEVADEDEVLIPPHLLARAASRKPCRPQRPEAPPSGAAHSQRARDQVVMHVEALQRASKQAECCLAELNSSDPRHVKLKLTMRAGAIGAVIGRGGSIIKHLKAVAASSGAGFAVLDFEQAGQRAMCVSGDYQGVCAVLDVLQDVMKADEAERSLFRQRQQEPQMDHTHLDMLPVEPSRGVGWGLPPPPRPAGGSGQVEKPSEVLRLDEDEEDWLVCPITLRRFIDPVVTADGRTYERSAIELWLQAHDSSPLTGEVLADKTLRPNLAMHQQLRACQARAAHQAGVAREEEATGGDAFKAMQLEIEALLDDGAARGDQRVSPSLAPPSWGARLAERSAEAEAEAEAEDVRPSDASSRAAETSHTRQAGAAVSKLRVLTRAGVPIAELHTAITEAAPLLQSSLPEGSRRTLEATISAAREMLTTLQSCDHSSRTSEPEPLPRASTSTSTPISTAAPRVSAPARAPLSRARKTPAADVGLVRVRASLRHDRVGSIIGVGNDLRAELRHSLGSSLRKLSFSDPPLGTRRRRHDLQRELTVVGTREAALEAIRHVNDRLPHGEQITQDIMVVEAL